MHKMTRLLQKKRHFKKAITGKQYRQSNHRPTLPCHFLSQGDKHTAMLRIDCSYELGVQAYPSGIQNYRISLMSGCIFSTWHASGEHHEGYIAIPLSLHF
jgi:hypothetical protein